LLVLSLTFRFVLLLSLASLFVPVFEQVRADEPDQSGRWLVEHSSDVFFGTVDIVTAGAGDLNATEYTILTTEVLKGGLTMPSLIVIRDEGPSSLIPKTEYLFFTYYDPALLRYVVTDPDSGVVPITSPDQRAELTAHWSDLIDQTACGYTDVLTLDGVVYARRDWNDDKRYLEREWVGPTIATVERQDTAATGCRADLADRSASVIPTGTKIQELKGYAPAFRVALRMPDRHRYLYEAIWSKNAQTGADLLYIRGRVTSITWGDDSDCPEHAICDVAAIETADPDVIARVVDIVLKAPAVATPMSYPTAPAPDPITGISLTFNLADGSTVHLPFNESDGASLSGIRIHFDELRAALRGEG
jgi:hypothetical protein